MSVEFKGIPCSSFAVPYIPVGHPRYVWRGHADTDVQRTWKTYGWKATPRAADTLPANGTPVARLRKV